MRSHRFPTLVFPIVLCFGFARTIAQDRAYLSATLEPAAKARAAYYKEAGGNNGDRFIGKTYTLDGKLKSEGRYADAALMIEDGPFVYYHPNGQVESSGNYVKGWKSGVWQRFDAEGRALSEKLYDPEVLSNVIFARADRMPEYPGGQAGLRNLVKDHVAERTTERAKGKLKASFIVEKDGSLTDVKVVEGTGGPVDELAMAAIKSTKWAPGLAKGRPVRVQMTLPLQL